MNRAEFAARLRAGGIINTWDLLQKFGGPIGETDLAVSYRPKPSGRMGICEFNKTCVWSSRRHIQAVFTGRRSVSFTAALDWAKKRYGITNWTPCPTSAGRGTYVPKDVVARARAFAEARP